MGLKPFFNFIAVLVLILGAHGQALGVTKGSGVTIHEFPVPPRIAEKVWFWEVVFSRYPSTSVLIHDVDHPHIIVDIIDFQNFAAKYRGNSMYSRREREEIIAKYVRRYELAIKRLSTEGKDALKRGSMEKRVFAVYSRNRASLKNLWAGQVSLRGQAGLKDEFEKAATRASQYLPYMEKIFRQKGLPVDLTRIAFVESMFNLNAVSKVGASGIWQFMPGTARSYLIVNPFLDERNSPTKATRAAASLLSFNYKELGTWPLAITAYNHGAASMARAVRQLGSRDIDHIVDRYRAPSFGFASRNFYAEFLAARNIYNMNFAPKRQTSPNPLAVTSITLPKRMMLHHIIEGTPLTKDILRKYNPCIQQRAFGQRQKVHLPANYELIVPNYLAQDVERAIARMNHSRRG